MEEKIEEFARSIFMDVLTQELKRNGFSYIDRWLNNDPKESLSVNYIKEVKKTCMHFAEAWYDDNN